MEHRVKQRDMSRGLVLILTISAILLSSMIFPNLGFQKNLISEDSHDVSFQRDLDKDNIKAAYDTFINHALDNYDLEFTTSGSANWISQTETTHDGEDAMQSGAITHNQGTSIQTIIDGPGKIGFWWKVNSQLPYDKLDFTLNHTKVISSISGDIDWTYYEYVLGFGQHLLTWRYWKDGSINGGLDKAWLDQVTYTAGNEGFNTTIAEISPNPSNNDGKITLDWNDVVGATKYYLYRHTSSFNNVSGLTPIATTTTSNYLDRLLENGTYYYRVVATNGTMNSSLSNEVSVVGQLYLTMNNQDVVIKTITPNPSTDGIINLDWDDIFDATKYYVYRNTTSFIFVTGLTPIAITTISSYQDTITDNGTYYYRVIASDGTKNTSISSEGVVTVQIPPKFETNEITLTATVTDKVNIILSWNAVPGATKYYVYMSETEFSDVSGLTAVAEVTNNQYSYQATKNGTFYFRIVATDGNTNTAPSNMESITVTITTDPGDGSSDGSGDGEPDGKTDNIWVYIIIGGVVVVVGAVIVVTRVKKAKKSTN
jgi:hypothetical protein